MGRFADFRSASASPPCPVPAEGQESAQSALGHGKPRIERELAVEIGQMSRDFQMYRPGHSGRCRPEGLPKQVREAIHLLDRNIELRDCIVHLERIYLLIDVLVLQAPRGPTGDCQDRRPAKPGVRQSGGQIGGANILRADDAHLVADARVTVSHVCGSLFNVSGKQRYALYRANRRLLKRHGLRHVCVRAKDGRRCGRCHRWRGHAAGRRHRSRRPPGSEGDDPRKDLLRHARTDRRSVRSEAPESSGQRCSRPRWWPR